MVTVRRGSTVYDARPIIDCATPRSGANGNELSELVTTKGTLHLETLLDEDSTFFGDLFAHVVLWRGEYYLEDGLHRALRAALQQRSVLHARVHEIRE